MNFEGGELVDDLLIILKGTIKIIKNFFPAFLFTVIGLAYIGWDERRDRLGGKVHENENQHNSKMPIMQAKKKRRGYKFTHWTQS